MLIINRLIKSKVLVVLLLLSSFTAGAQNTSYVNNHKIFAAVLSQAYGIPSSIILAVAIVESASGRAATAKVLNNHFGIVGKNEIVTPKGHKSRYKQYQNEVFSYIDFCRLISHKRFYTKLKDKTDAKVWAKAISKAGYSEEPEIWEKRILGAIYSNGL
jgi:flagellum-specific peptidoglycan hydrolase FlgJ